MCQILRTRKRGNEVISTKSQKECSLSQYLWTEINSYVGKNESCISCFHVNIIDLLNPTVCSPPFPRLTRSKGTAEVMLDFNLSSHRRSPECSCILSIVSKTDIIQGHTWGQGSFQTVISGAPPSHFRALQW